MTSRKTQQEIDKTFKKVAEGIQAFEGIYEKIRSTTNPAQRDKLEDNLKREIKKLQRFRDQIKSWAAGNEVKDKSPLLEQRRAIETVGYYHPLSSSCIWLFGSTAGHLGSVVTSSRQEQNVLNRMLTDVCLCVCSAWNSSRLWRRR